MQKPLFAIGGAALAVGLGATFAYAMGAMSLPACQTVLLLMTVGWFACAGVAQLMTTSPTDSTTRQEG